MIRKSLTTLVGLVLVMGTMLALAGMYPGAKIIVLDEECDVTVTFINSYAGANNEFGLDSPEKIVLGYGHDTPSGTSWNIGTFPAGVELIFYIAPSPEYVYFTGPAERNPDGVVHAAITDISYQKWEVGFEDLWGGGDRDYDDVILNIEGCLEIQEQGAPVADFTWSPSVPDEGAIVQFTDLSTDPDDDIVSWSWTFGDGGSSTVQNPTHIYGHGGDYDVTLTVTDSTDKTDSKAKTIQIKNVAPTVILTNATITIDEGASATFDGYFDDPSWMDTHTATWDFGDGMTATGTFAPGRGHSHHDMDAVSHVYGDNGVFTVTLTVEDDMDGIGTASATVTVYNLAPVVDMLPVLSIDEAGTATYDGHATDPGSDDLTFSWTWDYISACDKSTIYYNNGVSPDPPVSPQVNPMDVTDSASCQYGDNGLYGVTLTVYDDDGGTAVVTTTLTVYNLAPSASALSPQTIDEGSAGTITGYASDPGSDDLTFDWDFELGPQYSNVYYNDGIGPDPCPSPLGTYPFSANDTVQYSYCDDGVFTVTMTVEDDDGASVTQSTTITVNNVAPTVDAGEDKLGDEPATFEFTGSFADPGCDSWTWWWDFLPVLDSDGDGDPTNDKDVSGTAGATGTLPAVVWTFNDDFDGDVYLWVEDDDNGIGYDAVHVKVNNVAPAATISAYTLVDFTLRVAGEKWHDVTMYIYDQDGNLVGKAGVVRYPGSPDRQSVTISDVRADLTGAYTVKVVYTPPDDPVNGQPNGANPAWLIFGYEDECRDEVRLHHTFNVKHEETWIWEVNATPYLSIAGQPIHFESTSEDPGSDDATYIWDFGDETAKVQNSYYNDGESIDQYPSYWFGTYPFVSEDTAEHIYAVPGTYTVTLVVVDDDGGLTVRTLTIEINGDGCKSGFKLKKDLVIVGATPAQL